MMMYKQVFINMFKNFKKYDLNEYIGKFSIETDTINTELNGNPIVQVYSNEENSLDKYRQNTELVNLRSFQYKQSYLRNR